MEGTVKNKFFTGKFVLAPKFAGCARMEDIVDMKRKAAGEMISCMLALMLLLGGCGAEPDTQETLARGEAAEETEQGDAASENGAEGDVQNEAGAGGEDSGQPSEYLEIDEATKEELTTQLLLENELDTSILEEDGMTDRCTFALPEDFMEVEDIPGMYVTKRYPIDASTIYYAEMDKDISMQLMTEDTYVEQMESNFLNHYDMEVDVDLQSFEKIRISGHPAFRILCSYMVDGIEITQLAYVINADKSYVVTYSQTDEYYRMDEFEASAATIALESEE